MLSQRRSGLLLALTVVSLVGWFLYTFADPCAPDPCQPQPDIEGQRCGLPDCVWVSDGSISRFVGRYCRGSSPLCRTHSAGRCNHQVDVFCMVKEYRCLHADGTVCREGTVTRIMGPDRVQPTNLDCEGHRCRGPGSVITPQPAPVNPIEPK